MSEYTDCINKLLDVFKDMIDKADYNNLDDIEHIRIHVMNDMIYDIIYLAYHEYDHITLREYLDLDRERYDLLDKAIYKRIYSKGVKNV